MADRRMEIVKRDDTDFQLTFTDVDGNPIDLTGGTVFFTVKRLKTDADDDAVIATEITSFSDPESGVCILQLSDTDTDIPPRSYHFDIQLKQSNGKITSIQSGRFIVHQDITIRMS